jgi:hypothetical protein
MPEGIKRGLTYKIQKNLRKRGLLGTLKVGALKVFSMLREISPRHHRFKARQREFDRLHGVETEHILNLEDLDIQSRNVVDGTPYQATPIGTLDDVFSSAPIAHSDFTFVDLGSGMGRALLMASAFPFRKIIGVKFSPSLHAIAVRNIQSYRSDKQECKEIEALCMDGAEYSFPPENTLIYLFNPFRRPLMELLLRNLEGSLKEVPRQLFIVYYYPELRAVFDAAPFLEIVQESRTWVVYRNRESCAPSTVRAGLLAHE